ncbi:MAG: RICIN domain-containing protein [Clostridia bacterium]|nr:RICIN domain-containing protein [Clostridia bacterium]
MVLLIIFTIPAGYELKTGAATDPVDEGRYYCIYNVATGRVFDVPSGRDEDNLLIHSWTLSVSDAQQYTFKKSSQSGYYSIIPKCAPTRAIDNPNGSTAVGTQYQTYTQNGTDAQLFRLESDGNGNYRIINKKSGLALADIYSSSEDGIVQHNIENNQNQLWKISKAPDDYTYLNPIKKDGADPWVVQAGGYYYLCYSNGNNKIYIRKMRVLEGMRSYSDTIIYTAPESGERCGETWAPELIYIGGRWYVYFAADNGTNANHRMFVLEGGSNPNDPLDGSYSFKSRINEASDRWAIDGTAFEYGGEKYFVWSGWEATNGNIQNLYIAKMSNPWTLSTSRVCISEPTNSWEKTGGSSINEGPEVLIKDNKVHIVYSAAGSWADNYCLATLTCTDGNLLNRSSWTKSSGPVFQKTDATFGVGHASFVKSPDGTEDYIVYHAAVNSGAGWTRNIRMQLFTWTSDGYPYFGEPIDGGVALTRPSTDPTPAVNNYNYYKIVNVGTGRTLDIDNKGDANGTKVQTWTDNNTVAQRFRFINSAEQGWFGIVPKCAETRALDNPASSKSRNVQYQIYTQNGSNAQCFKLQEVYDGEYRIINKASLFALTDTYELTGGAVEQRAVQNSDYQLWRLIPMTQEEIFEPMQNVSVSTDDSWVDLGAWSYYFGSWNGSDGTYKGGVSADKFTLNISSNNKSQWGIQTALDNQPVTAGHTYRYVITVNSDKSGTVLSKDDVSNSEAVTTNLAVGDNTIEGTFTASGSTAKILLELASGIDVGTTLSFKGFSLVDITPQPVELAITDLTATENQNSVTVTVQAEGGTGTREFWFCVIGGGNVYAKSSSWTNADTFEFEKTSGSYSIRVYCRDTTGTKVVEQI